MLLIRAPFAEGRAFPDAQVTIFGHADLFDVTPTVERPSRKIRTSGFFSDFAELKPGDYVVHVDHGIGQFEGLRQIEIGRPARRVHAAAICRMTRACMFRWSAWTWCRAIACWRARSRRWTSWAGRLGPRARRASSKSVEDMADKLLELYAERKTGAGFAFSAGRQLAAGI